MTPYRNLSGDSGVLAYAIGADFIDVQFAGGDIYRYTSASAGAAALAQMKRLAASGRGLSTFISQVVRENYQSRR
jgi:hypothetical protein